MPYHKSKTSINLSGKYAEYFNRVDSLYNSDPSLVLNDSLKHELSRQFGLIPLPQLKYLILLIYNHCQLISLRIILNNHSIYGNILHY